MGPERSPVWDLAKQMGVNHGVFNLPNAERDEQPWEYEPLRRMTDRADRAGLDVQVIEQRPPMDDIRLARQGREDQLETVLELVRNISTSQSSVLIPHRNRR